MGSNEGNGSATGRLAFLLEASDVLGSSLDSATTARNLARLAVPQLAARCAVYLLQRDGSVRCVAVPGAESATPANGLSQAADVPDPVLRVLRSGEEELPTEQAVSMCLPLGARGRVDGAVVLEAGALGRGFGSEEIALARDLARRASSAIENARLYEERAHIARTLQQSLLPPQLPSIAGIEIAARYLPTGEGNEVGGDFYDVFETTEGDWALVMGDVCGKGADAAALTGLARYTIRTAAIQRRNPSQVLEMLNDAVIRQEAARFCTVAYARLEPTGNPAMRQRLGNDRFDSGVMSQLVSTGLLPATWVAPHARLTVCCGGHPLPLLLRRDGRIERVGNPGTLLGIFPDPHLEDDQVLLGPGDAVVFYTDGVSSGPDPTTGSIDPRVIDLLKACVGLSAADMADRIEEAAPDLQEGEARDDVAILVLRIED